MMMPSASEWTQPLGTNQWLAAGTNLTAEGLAGVAGSGKSPAKASPSNTIQYPAVKKRNKSHAAKRCCGRRRILARQKQKRKAAPILRQKARKAAAKSRYDEKCICLKLQDGKNAYLFEFAPRCARYFRISPSNSSSSDSLTGAASSRFT